jgi:hypothetical protein
MPIYKRLFLHFIQLYAIKKFSTYLVLAVVSLANLNSCKKDDETTPTPTLTKTDLLTAKSWKVTDVKIAGQTIFDSPLVEACEKDDLTKFNANKSITFDEGAEKCDASSPQSRTGSWEFTTNETKLNMTDSDGSVVEGTISTFTSTTLIVTEPNIYGSGVAGEVTYTAQ